MLAGKDYWITKFIPPACTNSSFSLKFPICFSFSHDTDIANQQSGNCSGWFLAENRGAFLLLLISLKHLNLVSLLQAFSVYYKKSTPAFLEFLLTDISYSNEQQGTTARYMRSISFLFNQNYIGTKSSKATVEYNILEEENGECLTFSLII